MATTAFSSYYMGVGEDIDPIVMDKYNVIYKRQQLSKPFVFSVELCGALPQYEENDVAMATTAFSSYFMGVGEDIDPTVMDDVQRSPLNGSDNYVNGAVVAVRCNH